MRTAGRRRVFGEKAAERLAFPLLPPSPREAAAISFTSLFLATVALAVRRACCSIAVNMLFFSRCFCLQYSALLVRRQREPTAAITPSVALERKATRLLQACLNLFVISEGLCCLVFKGRLGRFLLYFSGTSSLQLTGAFTARRSFQTGSPGEFSGCHAVAGQLKVFVFADKGAESIFRLLFCRHALPLIA